MSVITPEYSTASDSAPAFEHTPPTVHQRTVLTRPSAPDFDQARDNELLSYYFDANWTTKDIAEHFKLPIAVVAAWFQRADIVAIIDFIAAANERRARDIARANLPSTIEVLHRISLVRSRDSVAREASCALIRFARGPSLSKSASQRASKAKLAPGQDAGNQPHPDGSDDRSAFARARRACEPPKRGLHDITPAPPRQVSSTSPPARRTAADLISRAGSTFTPHHSSPRQCEELIKASRG
jgi:hypothetical protein